MLRVKITLAVLTAFLLVPAWLAATELEPVAVGDPLAIEVYPTELMLNGARCGSS